MVSVIIASLQAFRTRIQFNIILNPKLKTQHEEAFDFSNGSSTTANGFRLHGQLLLPIARAKFFSIMECLGVFLLKGWHSFAV